MEDEYIELIEGFIEELKKYGLSLEANNFHYHGFGSQGDGLCFDFEITHSEVVYFLKAIGAPEAKNFSNFWLDETILEAVIKTTKNVSATHYCHSNTRDLSLWFNSCVPKTNPEEFNKLFMAKKLINQYIKEWYVRTCDTFYKSLEEHNNEVIDLISEDNEQEEIEIEREEWDDDSDESGGDIESIIINRIDPDMNIRKIVNMVDDCYALANTNSDRDKLIKKFIDNFEKEYIIIKRVN